MIIMNPIGVLTNSPPFDWHIINLRNYINLTATSVPPVELSNITLTSTGDGSGMVGLPGDFTPPSRFVRMAVLSQTVLPVETAEEGVLLAINIIGNINIAKGMARTKEANGVHYDHTEYVTVSDLTNKEIYFRTYDNPNYRRVKLADYDLDGRNIISIPMKMKPHFETARPAKVK